EEPHFVLLDGAADRAVDVPVLVEIARGADTPCNQRVVDVVGLERFIGIGREHRPGKVVAAFARDDVDEHSAGDPFGGDRADFVRELLHRAGVHVHAAGVEPGHGVHRHAFDHLVEVGLLAAVDPESLPHVAGRSADILRHRIAHRLHLDAGYERADRLLGTAAWNRVDDFLADDALLDHVLDVHGRAAAGDRDRLFDAADFQFAVD